MKTLFLKNKLLILKWLGYDLLDQNQTIAFLTNHVLTVKPGNSVLLPDVKVNEDAGSLIFRQHLAEAHDAYVWRYRYSSDKKNIYAMVEYK